MEHPMHHVGRAAGHPFKQVVPLHHKRLLNSVMAGMLWVDTLGVPSIWAVREDCSVDLSFGKNGMAAVSAKSPTEVQDGVNAMAVDGFGRIVATVASTMSGKLHVARFTSEGQIDKSFGAGQGYISVSPSDGAAQGQQPW
jgi:hypothetical protein